MQQPTPNTPAPTTQPTQAPPATGQSSQPAPSGKKSGSAATIIIIIVAVLVVLGIGGYFVSRYVARKAAEKLTEGLIGSATGTNVDLGSSSDSLKATSKEGSVAIGDKATWPTDLPSDVPKFSAGKITSAIKINGEGGGWSVLIESVKQADVDSYVSQLKSAGWSADEAVSVAGANINQLTKGNYSIGITFDSSSNGVSISVTPKAS